MSALKDSIRLSKRIDNHLLLNSSFTNNLGLMHGKMGLAIYFFHIGQNLNNKIYKKYAEELIDEIHQEINSGISIDFENGLAGIGWGVEYLTQNGFIDADTDEVLEDFDNLIIKGLLQNTPSEIGLLNGLIGLGAYLIKRIQNNKVSNEEEIAKYNKKQALIFLIDELDRGIQSIDETSVFDITWDYPMLIWFLTDLYKQKVNNDKIEELILRCLKPLNENINLPKSNGNKLMLAFSIINLLHGMENNLYKIKTSGNELSQKLDNFNNISQRLLKGVSHENILTELSSVSSSIRHGLPGIVLIYRHLFKLTKDPKYNEDATNCSNHDCFFKDFENSFNYNLEQSEKLHAFGLLNGLSGIRLINSN